MGQDSFIPVATNARSRSDLVERGFSRQPLRVDVDIARSLEALSHAAWSVPKDKYYDGGDRYRSLNRVRAEIVEGGVKVWLSEESTPYVQLKKYNTTIGGQPREYAPLPPAIAGSIGVRKMIAHHLHYRRPVALIEDHMVWGWHEDRRPGARHGGQPGSGAVQASLPTRSVWDHVIDNSRVNVAVPSGPARPAALLPALKLRSVASAVRIYSHRHQSLRDDVSPSAGGALYADLAWCCRTRRIGRSVHTACVSLEHVHLRYRSDRWRFHSRSDQSQAPDF